MGKQHDTFPEEKTEMPVRRDTPEIGQPADPKEPEIPQEDPQVVPDEYPPGQDTRENPGQPKVI
jgi:hypothetical protein